jgi:predicted Fe-Mo cluster-binding NifX family protein
MNVRLEYDMTWSAAIWFEGRLQINEYTAELSIYTNTSDSDDHVTSLARLNHFVYHELANTVFINQSDQEQIQALTSAGINVTPLPSEPIDQIIGIALYCKLNAILEQRMMVTDVTMHSNLGDNVRYLHSDHESLGPCDETGWWVDSSPMHSNLKPTIGNKRQVVKLNRTPTWRDLDLEWSGTPSTTNDSATNTVVFAKFPTDEN